MEIIKNTCSSLSLLLLLMVSATTNNRLCSLVDDTNVFLAGCIFECLDPEDAVQVKIMYHLICQFLGSLFDLYFLDVLFFFSFLEWWGVFNYMFKI